MKRAMATTALPAMAVVVLLACCCQLAWAYQTECNSQWNTHSHGAWKRVYSDFCEKTSLRSVASCPAHAQPCCLDSDCGPGDLLECHCHIGCPVLTCQVQLNQLCKALMPPKHGQLAKVPGNNMKVKVECDRNTELLPTTSDGFMQCNQTTGEWREKIECRKTCNQPPRPRYSNDETDRKSTYITGSTFSYKCIDGYKFREGHGTSTCMEREGATTWTRVECIPQTCPALVSSHPSLTMRASSYKFRSRVKFSCPSGFDLGGESTIQCVANGTLVRWNGEVPTCREKPCSPRAVRSNIPPTADVALGDTVPSGTNVTYSCPLGFFLVGLRSVVCSRGQWSAVAPICKPFCCSLRDLWRVNSDVVSVGPMCSREGANRATIRCNKCSKSLTVTSMTVLCIDQTWPNTSSFVCQRMTCPPSPVATAASGYAGISSTIHPPSMATNETKECGDRLTFSCPASMKPGGAAQSECLPSGSWSNEIPPCIRRDARCPPFAYDGQRVQATMSNGNQIGSEIRFQCSDICQRPVDPSALATCRLNLTSTELYWEARGNSSCHAVHCLPYESIAVNNTRLKTNVTRCGQSSRVQCRSGFHRFFPEDKATRPTMACKPSGKWASEPATASFACVRNCTGLCTGVGQECFNKTVSGRLRFACRCIVVCPRAVAKDAVCGSNGQIYGSSCLLRQAACSNSKRIEELPAHLCGKGGSCWQTAPEKDYAYNSDTTPCTGRTGIWQTFNRGTCKQFDYNSNCHRDTGNVFNTTVRNCYRECVAERICTMSPDRGSCSATQRRYFFNCATSVCEAFTYTGCGGNQNSFVNKRDCLAVATRQKCLNSTGVCDVKYTPPLSCCVSEQERFQNMCRTADFAFTGNVVRAGQTNSGYTSYFLYINNIVAGNNLQLRDRNRLVSGRHIPLYAAKRPRTSSCPSCVLIPNPTPPDEPNVFLMGRRRQVGNDHDLFIEDWSYGFEYQRYEEGRQKVCQECPVNSKIRKAAGC